MRYYTDTENRGTFKRVLDEAVTDEMRSGSDAGAKFKCEIGPPNKWYRQSLDGNAWESDPVADVTDEAPEELSPGLLGKLQPQVRR